MSRFKSLKEISLKKKIFICLIVLVLIVAIVFLVIRFGFPDADVTKPHSLAYEVGADSEAKNQFEEAFGFFASNCSDEQKEDSSSLRNLYYQYIQRLYVTNTASSDRFLLPLREVKDVNKLNKKIKKLDGLKKNVDSSKNDAISFCKNQVMPYKEGTSDYSRISDYFSSFAKKLTNYLKDMREFQNCLTEIVQTSTDESVYSNYLTKFSMSLNNKRLSVCVDRCQKKFIEGENILIDAPKLQSSSIENKTTMFKLKDDAIETFVADKNLIVENIDAVNSMSWLSGWLEVFATERESEFLKKIDKASYNQFKTFMESLFMIQLEKYPSAEVKA